MIKLFSLNILFYILSFLTVNGQSSISDSLINAHLVDINYSFQIPQQDLHNRFGNSSAVGLGYTFKTRKRIEFGVGYQFIFGNNVKDSSMLDELTTSFGGIINQNGEFGVYNLLQRGHYLSINAGYHFLTVGPNPNSGFFVKAGVGLLIHKIVFQNLNDDIPQFNARNKEYKAGYDRYTSGISLNEFIGYKYLSNNGLINFYAGVELIQGFTKLRRDYQVDYPIEFDNSTRNDFLIGFKVGWILPIYKKPAKDFYY